MNSKPAPAVEPETNLDAPMDAGASTPAARPVAGALDVKGFHARMQKRFPKILAELGK